MVVCEAFKNGSRFSELALFPSCFYLYFFLIVPLAPVQHNFSLVLAVAPHCRALSWKGYHLWLVLRVRAQMAQPLQAASQTCCTPEGDVQIAGGRSQTD